GNSSGRRGRRSRERTITCGSPFPSPAPPTAPLFRTHEPSPLSNPNDEFVSSGGRCRWRGGPELQTEQLLEVPPENSLFFLGGEAGQPLHPGDRRRVPRHERPVAA